MNGYKNSETFLLSLWMHNDEFLNNGLLPGLLESCDNNKLEAGIRLSLCFLQGDDSFMAEYLKEENYKIMLEDVGDFDNVAWEELFTNCEG